VEPILTVASPPVIQSTVDVIVMSKSVGGEATNTSWINIEQPLASITLIWYNPKLITLKLTDVDPVALNSEFE